MVLLAIWLGGSVLLGVVWSLVGRILAAPSPLIEPRLVTEDAPVPEVGPGGSFPMHPEMP